MSDSPKPQLAPINPQELLQQLLGDGRALLDKGRGQIEQGTPQLTEQARQLGRQGEDFLIDKLGLEDTPATRENVRTQAKYAGIAGGLALLLKSRSARKLAALGGLAALGTIAYRGHKRGAMPSDFKDAIGLLKGDAADARATVLIRAMVAAAKADGTISADEKAIIDAYPGANVEEIAELLATPADPKAIAAMATSDQLGAEIYAVSCRVADGLNPLERDYLDSLAMALRLDPEAAAMIETDVRLG